jgi:predicted Zn-dependent peptidase
MTGGVLSAQAASGSPLTSPDKLKYAPLQFNLPQTQRVVLDNGIVLHILENHELPLVNINALVKTGTMYDPQGKAGVAELTAYVMRTGGTKKLNSTEIDKQLDFIAASVSINMSLESAQIHFSILKENLKKGIDLLSQIVMQPALEKDKFELAVQLKKEELRRIKDNPQKLAFREFNKLIYANDPRGSFSSYNSLANIERNDLVDFHNRFFLPNNIIFAVSGDITREEAVEIFRRYFGEWQPGEIPVYIPPPTGKSKAGVYCIDKNLPQSTIVSGQFTTSKTDPDFYSFSVLDFILGSGGFSSRIFSAVRNNEGLAYSAGSFYRARPAYGVFGTYAFTKTPSTMKTLSLINSILEKIKTNTITSGETNWARQSIINGFVFSFDTPEHIAWQHVTLESEKLPEDFLINYRDNIEKVSVKDLNNAAVKYLDNTKNVVLILGDSKKFDKSSAIEDQLIFIIPEE